MKQPPLPDRRVRPALAGPMVRRNALCSVAAMAMIPALAGSGWSQSRPAGNLPAITQVAQIRRLTPAEAKRKYPIRLKGVITYHAPEYKVTFFQDDTAGIFIYEATDTQIGAGSLVEIDGNTTPGDFAPSIEHAEIHLIGRAPLPAAAPKSIDALLTAPKTASGWRCRESFIRPPSRIACRRTCAAALRNWSWTSISEAIASKPESRALAAMPISAAWWAPASRCGAFAARCSTTAGSLAACSFSSESRTAHRGYAANSRRVRAPPGCHRESDPV